MYGNLVYQLFGYYYKRVNTKVMIDRNTVASSYMIPYSMSTARDRIICNYGGNTYVYYPITNTWTQWNLPATGQWTYIANSVATYGYRIFVAPINSSAPGGGNVLAMQDKVWDNTMPIDIELGDPTLLTKMFTFGNPAVWKRLYWWGVDCIIQNSTLNAIIRMAALPYQFSSFQTFQTLDYGQTWSSIQHETWRDVLNDSPFAQSYRYEVTSPDRKYLKGYKSVRFPRIQFKITLPGFDHTAVSSIHMIEVSYLTKQTPVSRSEGVPA
jgi:hypothetical protein